MAESNVRRFLEEGMDVFQSRADRDIENTGKRISR